MGKRIQTGNRRFIPYPYPFLPLAFEAGIVTLTFRAEGITAFKIFAVPVNGKPQVIRKRDIFGTATVFPAIIKVFVPAGAAPLEFFRGQQNFWRVRPQSENLPSFYMASPASQMGFP